MNEKLDDHVSFTVLHMSSNADGSLLLAVTDKQKLLIFVMGETKIIRTFFGASNDEYSNPRCYWSFDETYVYCTSQDHCIVSWEVSTQRIVNKLVGHKGIIRDMKYDIANNMMISGGFDKSVRIWGLDNNN